jgi:hypothetical protein
LLISIFTPCLQPGEELEGVLGVAVLEVVDALFDGLVQSGSFVIVEVVATGREHVIDGHQLDDLALGQIRGWVVEYEPAILDVGLERLHDDGSLAVVAVDGHAAVFVTPSPSADPGAVCGRG